MGIAPSHVDDPETTTTTTGESKTNDNNNKNTFTIDGIIGVLPSLGEVPGELECAICAEVLVLFFPRVFFVSIIFVFFFFRVFLRARDGEEEEEDDDDSRAFVARARASCRHPSPLSFSLQFERFSR